MHGENNIHDKCALLIIHFETEVFRKVSSKTVYV